MRTAIVYASVHHGNTEKLVKRIAEECQMDLIDAVKQPDADLSSYDMIGFASGIYFSKFHQSILEFNEDMAYALSYLSIYNNQLNVPKMHREMNNLMIIYGLSDMIYRGMTLVKFYAPNGVMLSEILHSCFCSHYNKTDVEVQQELGIGRTSFYKMKKQALGYLGFYFYEIVVPQAKDKRFKPSLGVEEE